jgi:hypothetical protein
MSQEHWVGYSLRLSCRFGISNPPACSASGGTANELRHGIGIVDAGLQSCCCCGASRRYRRYSERSTPHLLLWRLKLMPVLLSAAAAAAVADGCTVHPLQQLRCQPQEHLALHKAVPWLDGICTVYINCT